MKNSLKKLVSETAIYGISHSLGRFLNFLLVPLYTSVLSVKEYGIVNVYYSLVGFAIVLLLYGMETAFFNFARSHPPKKALSTAMRSVGISTLIFVALGLLMRQHVANFLEYPDQPNFVALFVFILALDALSTLPLAWLRYERKALKFGAIRLTGILVNIGLNLVFLLLLPDLEAKGIHFTFYNPDFGIGYIFLSNLIASALTLTLLLPQWKMIQFGFDKVAWKKMLRYARPLIWVGLAGIANETLDRILLKKILADNIADYQIGVYSAFYKLSIIMTLAVQSFRYAAEPFFFEHSKESDAPKTYASVMHYFVIALSGIFLATSVFAEPVGRVFIRKAEYFDHPQWSYIVPILLLANLFLGITYNLNIWYKLNDRTKVGMYISISAAVGTIVLNFALIPVIGILGSAITTLIVYLGMAVASYSLGKKYYPIPYNLKMIFFYIGLSLALYIGFEAIHYTTNDFWISGISSVAIFGLTAYLLERPGKKG